MPAGLGGLSDPIHGDAPAWGTDEGSAMTADDVSESDHGRESSYDNESEYSDQDDGNGGGYASYGMKRST